MGEAGIKEGKKKKNTKETEKNGFICLCNYVWDDKIFQ